MIGAAPRPRQLQAGGDSVTARLARVREHLARVVAAMNDPAFELDANEGAAVVAAYNLARGAGVTFDPFTGALVGVLRRQIAETVEGVEDFEDERVHRGTASRTSFHGDWKGGRHVA